MSDLRDRFTSLDAARPPELWSEIELRASQPAEAHRGGGIGLALGAFGGLVVIGLVVLTLVWFGEPGTKPIGASPSPTSSLTSIPSPRSAEVWFNSDHDSWTMLDELVPHNRSTKLQFRAAWEHGYLCLGTQVRSIDSDETIETYGGCINDLSALAADESFVWVDGSEFSAPFTSRGLVLSRDVTRVEVELAYGDVVQPELFEIPGMPAEWRELRTFWLRSDSPVVRVRAYDAAGHLLVEVNQLPLGVTGVWWESDHDTWPLLSELVPDAGSFKLQFRAAWVEDHLCHTEQVRSIASDEQRSAGGGCTPERELATAASGRTLLRWGGSEAEVVPIAYRVWFTSTWLVLTDDVARVEVELESGDVVQPELLEISDSPEGWSELRMFWVPSDSPVTRVRAYDAAGQVLDEVAEP